MSMLRKSRVFIYTMCVCVWGGGGGVSLPNPQKSCTLLLRDGVTNLCEGLLRIVLEEYGVDVKMVVEGKGWLVV